MNTEENTEKKEKVLVIKCGLLIDGTGCDPVRDVNVLVKGSKIAEVGTISVPAGVDIIDASDKVVMPGLIDLHIHPTKAVDPADPKNLAAPRHWPYELQLIAAVKNLEEQLRTGVTTVRCMGVGPELRDAVNKRLFSGPRVFVAGHFRSGVDPTGPYECRKYVREMVAKNVDFIKIRSTGGVTHNGSVMQGGVRIGPESTRGTVEEHRAIVEEAHDVGLKVAVHAHGYEGLKRAVIAGVDTVEHGEWIDDEIAKMMVEKGIFLVPTLTISRFYGWKTRDEGCWPQSWSKTINTFWPEKVIEALKIARKYGVKIACGTDGGNPKDYPKKILCGEELELLVKYGEMSEMEAIVAATKTSAEALGKDEFIGTIEPGKYADIIVVDGNPLKDIMILQETERIRMVIKGGKIEVNRGL